MNLSATSRWYESAVTVAGSWSGLLGSSLNKLNGNAGLAVAQDGTLYVADTGNRRVVVIKPNSTTAVATIGQGSISDGFKFSSVVDVFVTDTHIYVLDRGTPVVKKWLRNVSSPNTISGSPYNISIPEGATYIFLDKDNNLYMNNIYSSIVVRISSNSSNSDNIVTVAGNGTYGSESEQLKYPYGIFVDDALAVYVADSRNHRIQKWAVGASSGVTVAGNGQCNSNSLSEICDPNLVFVDSNQYIFTFDNYFYRMVRWAPNSNIGECIAACSGISGIQSDHVFGVYAIAFDKQGSLFVSDQANNRVQKFQIMISSGELTDFFKG